MWDWTTFLHYLHSLYLIKGAGISLALSIGAMATGLVCGTIAALMRRSRYRALRAPASFYVWLFRGTPVLEGKRRLSERGIEVVGPTDNGFCKSIYFFDPSGHRMEMTAKTEKPGDRDRFAQSAPVVLAEWAARKKEGALTSEVAHA